MPFYLLLSLSLSLAGIQLFHGTVMSKIRRHFYISMALHYFPTKRLRNLVTGWRNRLKRKKITRENAALREAA